MVVTSLLENTKNEGCLHRKNRIYVSGYMLSHTLYANKDAHVA